jgi:hypothetical protein
VTNQKKNQNKQLILQFILIIIERKERTKEKGK